MLSLALLLISVFKERKEHQSVKIQEEGGGGQKSVSKTKVDKVEKGGMSTANTLLRNSCLRPFILPSLTSLISQFGTKFAMKECSRPTTNSCLGFVTSSIVIST